MSKIFIEDGVSQVEITQDSYVSQEFKDSLETIRRRHDI